MRSALEGFAARARGLTQAPDGPRVLLDCTEVRDRRYYTGVVFEAFAPGSGRPVLAGGRYDTFYGGFGLELPAAGFAVDRAALLEAGAGSEPLPVLRVGSSERTEDSGRHLVQVLDALRGAGYDAARAPGLSAERLEPSPWVLVEGATLRFNLGPSEERGTLDDLLAHLAAAP